MYVYYIEKGRRALGIFMEGIMRALFDDEEL